MAYPLRQYVPGQTYEVTCRAIQGRPLLTGSEEVNATFLGVLARAALLYGIAVHVAVTLTNHYHLLVTPQDANDMAQFLRFLNHNVSRKVGPLVDWSGAFWGRRATCILVSEEPAAQAARLHYLLAHGVKEGLVARVSDWSGVHSARALIDGESLRGVWRGQAIELQLTPLPAFADLPAAEYQRMVAALVAEIEQGAERKPAVADPAATAPDRSASTDAAPAATPGNAPGRRLPRRTPAPAVHAATAEVERRLLDLRRAFIEAYRQAADAERSGERGVVYPPHCFPPGRRARSARKGEPAVTTLLW